MVSGTTNAIATAPTISAFSSTFARMPGTLLFSESDPAAARRRPCHYEVLCNTKYSEEGCLSNAPRASSSTISSPLEQQPAGEQIGFERADWLGRHPGSEELR